jgi:hypothetical protein
MPRFVPPLPYHYAELHDPLRAMLMLCVLVKQNIPAELQALIGLCGLDVEALEAAYEKPIARLRELETCRQLLTPEYTASLLLARITEMTLGATSPSQAAALCRALDKLPLWVRDPQTAKLETEARRLEAKARILEAQQRIAKLASSERGPDSSERVGDSSERGRKSASSSLEDGETMFENPETSALEVMEIKSPNASPTADPPANAPEAASSQACPPKRPARQRKAAPRGRVHR